MRKGGAGWEIVEMHDHAIHVDEDHGIGRRLGNAGRARAAGDGPSGALQGSTGDIEPAISSKDETSNWRSSFDRTSESKRFMLRKPSMAR